MEHFHIALSVSQYILYNITYSLPLFDKMITNYPGILQCLRDDFADLCNYKYMEEIEDKGEILLYNTKYKFAFHNETPQYPTLWELQRKLFPRIQAFRECLQNPNHNVTFYLMRHNTIQSDLTELKEIISNKYPEVSFQIVPLFLHDCVARYTLKLLKFEENDAEVDRLNYWTG